MIIVTGAAGFIGSCMVAHLNELGRSDLWLVDDFVNYPDKLANLNGKSYLQKTARSTFLEDLRKCKTKRSTNSASPS